MNIRSAYQDSLNNQGHTADPAQESVVEQLGILQDRLVHGLVQASGFSHEVRSLFRSSKTQEQIAGLYLWGDVGRGKTFLMDLFFETLPIEQKTRIHFHRMMADVHARLKAINDVEDPLDKIAADLSKKIRVLCFDEFFISDIADAMILGRLLDGLFRRGGRGRSVRW